MTTNRTSHTDCTHEATKAARAACRKARAAGPSAEVLELVRLADGDWILQGSLFYAASRFAGVRTDDALEAATAVVAHFAPSGDEAKDARRRANGWIITTDPRYMLTIANRARS